MDRLQNANAFSNGKVWEEPQGIGPSMMRGAGGGRMHSGDSGSCCKVRTPCSMPTSQYSHKNDVFIDVRSPPRHPDHPNGCSPLLRVFLCTVCAGGCMVCGMIMTMMTMAPFALTRATTTLSIPSLSQPASSFTQARASMKRVVTAWMDMDESEATRTSSHPSHSSFSSHSPPSSVDALSDLTRQSFRRLTAASVSASRADLWKRLPEWFDQPSGMFDAVTAILDLSRVLNHTLTSSRRAAVGTTAILASTPLNVSRRKQLKKKERNRGIE